MLEERSDLSMLRFCGRADVCGFGGCIPCKGWVFLNSQDTGNGFHWGHSCMMQQVPQALATRKDNHGDGEASQKENHFGSGSQMNWQEN